MRSIFDGAQEPLNWISYAMSMHWGWVVLDSLRKIYKISNITFNNGQHYTHRKQDFRLYAEWGL